MQTLPQANMEVEEPPFFHPSSTISLRWGARRPVARGPLAPNRCGRPPAAASPPCLRFGDDLRPPKELRRAVGASEATNPPRACDDARLPGVHEALALGDVDLGTSEGRRNWREITRGGRETASKRRQLLQNGPKVGRSRPPASLIACKRLATFAASLNSRQTLGNPKCVEKMLKELIVNSKQRAVWR